jgi:hypothetical protein
MKRRRSFQNEYGWIRHSFPGLPALLLSATDLVRLTLLGIPHSGHIPPEAMSTYLSALVRLEDFVLEFQLLRSRPGQESRCQPRSTRSVLPSLTRFKFHGVSRYPEDLVAQIGAPLLNQLGIMFFPRRVFDISHSSGSSVIH